MYEFAVGTQFLTCRFYIAKCGTYLLLLPPTVSGSKGGAPSQYPWNAGPPHGTLAVADTFVHYLSIIHLIQVGIISPEGPGGEGADGDRFPPSTISPSSPGMAPKSLYWDPQSNLGRFACWSFSVLPWGESGQLYIHWYFPIIYYLDRIAWLIIDHRTVTD